MTAQSSRCRRRSAKRGFALVVTLSLMILLTILAVGLLSLSSISLRSSNQSAAMGIARAIAKMTMLLALGDLQKQLGPDPRVPLPQIKSPALTRLFQPLRKATAIGRELTNLGQQRGRNFLVPNRNFYNGSFPAIQRR
jgi:type II secretory pathway pseudopilin PulG